MDRDPHAPQTFDPERSDAPFLPDAPPGGGLVLLVVASSVPDGDWAERTALALASGWAGKKRRILLADLALARPGLHHIVGVENGEGMTDAFLFGSSVLKVAVPVREKGFLFVPAGTATARPEVVASSPRWSAVVDACDRIQATLVVFLPSDLPGGKHLLQRATDVFLLTDAGGQSSAALQAGLGDRLRGVLTPPESNGAAAAPPAGPGAESPADEFAFLETAAAAEDDFAMPGPGAEALAGLSGLGLDLSFEAEAQEHEQGAPADAPQTSPNGAGEGEVLTEWSRAAAAPAPTPEPVQPEWARAATDSSEVPERTSSSPRAQARAVVEPDPVPGRSRTPALAGAAALVVVAAAAAAWFGFIPIPGFSRPAAADPNVAAPAPAATVASSPAAAPTEPPPLRVSLALGAFEDAAVARLQASSLSEQRPDLLFVVAPVESGGTVYYRLLAGPAEDSSAAVAIREKLATTLTREDPSSWTIRPTPLAFELGDRADLAEAKARIADLASVDIPAYVLELPPRTATGAIRLRYRVYGGAFADVEEAAYFQSLLVSKGFPDARLTERTGRHPE